MYHRGFCYFNSVAIAAKQLKDKLKTGKILILDWVCMIYLYLILAEIGNVGQDVI